MNIDTLSGCELDAAVARHVFGFVVREQINARMRESDFVRREYGEQWTRCAFYGSSLSASLTVNEKLARLGWKMSESAFGQSRTRAGRTTSTWLARANKW